MDRSARVIVLTEVDRDGKVALGMNLFLASWSVMFLAVLALCALVRAHALALPTPGTPPLPLGFSALATAVLTASAATMQVGLERVRKARPHALPWWLLATLGLGGLFLALQAWVCGAAWRAGLDPHGAFGSTFYVVTGFHAVHAAVAVALVAWLARGALALRYHARNYLMVTLVARYWHFQAAAWLAAFLALYAW